MTVAVVIVVALLAITFVSAEIQEGNKELKVADRVCTSQNDCDPVFECCSKRFLDSTAYCVKRRLLNELCLDKGYGDVMYNGLYDITCPCLFNLTCVKEEFYGNGRWYSKNPRCRQPGYTPGNANIRTRTASSSNYAGAGAGSGASSYSQSFGGQRDPFIANNKPQPGYPVFYPYGLQ